MVWLCLIGGLKHRPNVNAAREVFFKCQMFRSRAKSAAIGKDLIHDIQDCQRGAKGIIQSRRLKRLINFAQFLGKLVTHPVKPIRICALEGIDRLFLIAHNKDCSGHICPSAFARGEFLSEEPDDIPLRWAGVLGLIHKNVINATVQAK